MRRLIAVHAGAWALMLTAMVTVQPAAAAPVEKVGVCHLTQADPITYEYLSIPAGQFAPTKSGHLRGHARHAALGLDILGLSEEECLALNTPA